MKFNKFFLFIIISLFLTGCSKPVINTDYILTSEALYNQVRILTQINELNKSEKIDEVKFKEVLTECFAVIKEAKLFYLGIQSENEYLKKAVKSQLDMIAVYENMEKVFNDTKDVQKTMKYFYFADKYYREFLENIKLLQQSEIKA